MTNFDHLGQQLSELRDNQRFRQLVPRACAGVWVTDTDGIRRLNFGGNDYLGIAGEPLAGQLRSGSGASALLCGWSDQHQRLADSLAEFESTESAVLFPSGYAACSGTVATLAARDDLILSDELNHASLIDGCRLSRAERFVYPHRDWRAVEQTLEQQRGRFKRAWIVTDGVFSMDGHLAPLRELCDVADRHDACLVVDEAHGTGVLGESGCGACEALGVRDRVPIRIGTLSKAIGSQGGFVAGPQVVIDYLINRCRSLIFSTALSPAAVSAAQVGLDLIRAQPQRREKVHGHARRVNQAVANEVDSVEACVPIVPVLIGSDARAQEASRQLRLAGIYAPAIRPPTVPEGTARLRVSLSAAHDEAMVDQLLASITSAGLLG